LKLEPFVQASSFVYLSVIMLATGACRGIVANVIFFSFMDNWKNFSLILT